MATEIEAPNEYSTEGLRIFLAGSIEQDTAKAWQKRVVSMFKDYMVTILNPRRDAWNASWKNIASNKQFRQQVEWELDALEAADVIIMYFDPATKSPISLLELGLFADTDKLHVICPPGFWRKGNVDIVCERKGIKQFSSLTKAVDYIKKTHF